MDGYAVRLGDLATLASRRLTVAAEVAIGHEPPALPAGQAVRIFTGGAVPAEADAVIPRERVTELPDAIELPADLRLTPEQHIRRRGENLPAGQNIIETGAPITPAVAAALAAFGAGRPRVYRRLRLSILITGNELLGVEAAPQPWQLRDSNGPMLASLFSNIPWIESPGVQRIQDDPAAIQSAIRAALNHSDALLLTGGVSMGDYDYVPAAVEATGGRIVFHRVALRPGKPLLGAIGPEGQAIFGLPGNPVSSLTTARRFAAEALRKRAGLTVINPAAPMVKVTNPDDQQVDLWWYRPVRLTGPGQAELVRSQGSGDLVSAARSDGFIEVPPAGEAEKGVATHFSFYPWSLT
jgi:molybdopterin molybdotransferase